MSSFLALAGSMLLVLAQAAGTPGAPTHADRPYRVGPGDVLEVVVEGRPDLSRLPTVQTTGAIFLPRAGEVEVGGLTTEEIGARIAPRLAGEDLTTPQVSIRVREFQSQFVWVHGEVARPGRKPLRSGTRLVDALLDAGGFTSRASGEVTVERQNGTFADGRRFLAVIFSGGSPSPDELHSLGLRLTNGDLVVATTQHWVIVSGEVSQPGRYPLEGDLTLGRLVEEAGGLTPFGSSQVTLRRSNAGTGATDVEVDLRAVRSGAAADPALSPGDHVVVRAKRL
jgi:polysaccharide export outer membrane protein